MSKRNSDSAILAAGVGLWYVGAKTFSDYHGSVQAGTVESFQHEHATAIGSVATLAGLGLVVYGVYRMDRHGARESEPSSPDSSRTTRTNTVRANHSSRSPRSSTTLSQPEGAFEGSERKEIQEAPRRGTIPRLGR